jgi:hypothetical protein
MPAIYNPRPLLGRLFSLTVGTSRLQPNNPVVSVIAFTSTINFAFLLSEILATPTSEPRYREWLSVS